MRVISLFTGICGLDIGFSAAGFDVVAQVEFDEYCRRVAKRHAPEWWPNAEQFTDVRTFGRKDIAGTVDVICGGFPCQPHSVAGKRKGEDDSRNLWPDFARIIGEFRPRCVLLENVPGIISTGYASHVTAELAALGYDAQWGIISASDAGAPHKRARWFCVAYANIERQLQPHRFIGEIGRRYSNGGQPLADTGSIRESQLLERQPHNYPKRNRKTSARRRAAVNHDIDAGHNVLGNAKSAGLSQRLNGNGNTPCARPKRRNNSAGQRVIVKRRLGRAVARIPRWLDKPRWPAYQGEYQHDWESPRSIPPKTDQNRTARIKALGNAVVPQLAYLLAVEIYQTLGDNNG